MPLLVSRFRLFLGVLLCLTVFSKFCYFYAAQKTGWLPAIPQIPTDYLPAGNCSSAWRYGARISPSPDLLGGYIPSRGVYEADNHPLSSILHPEERLLVLGWVYSPPPPCLVEKIASVIRSASMQLILIHTSLDLSHFSLLLNLLVSLDRCGVDVNEILLVTYDYEPIPIAIQSLLSSAKIQYISTWDFMLPSSLLKGTHLSAPQFFFVRNVIHLKLMKMGYSVVHMDSDIVVLRDHPFKHFDIGKYSIEAAPGSSPSKQRRKWGHTLNCGYMSLVSSKVTIQFFEHFLAYNFDSVDPIDQWALNQVLYSAGVKFELHRGWIRKFVEFENDNGPINGQLQLQEGVLHVQMLNPQEFFAGRWLFRQENSQLTFGSFIRAMRLSPRTVHVTHIQGGVKMKIESMKEKGLWFLQDDWETQATTGKFQSLGSLDNGVPKPF